MKKLTLTQLKKWETRCNGYDWESDFKKTFGRSALMVDVEKELLKRKDWNALNFIIEKRLLKLNRKKVCWFAYKCATRVLKYARKEDLKVLKRAIGFAKEYAKTGKVNKSAARSAAVSAWSVAESAWSAVSAWSAAEFAAWFVARSAAESARSAAESARSAELAVESARSAVEFVVWSVAGSARSAEYKWQLKVLRDIENK